MLMPGVTVADVTEVLRGAAWYFDACGGNYDLCVGAWARRQNREPCDWSSSSATWVCLVGALRLAERERKTHWKVRTEVRQVLKKFLGVKSLTRWNDQQEQGHRVEALLALLQCASALEAG